MAGFTTCNWWAAPEDGEAGLKLCQSEQPDVALIDIRLPKLDGLDLIQRLVTDFPKMRLLAMSGLMT